MIFQLFFYKIKFSFNTILTRLLVLFTRFKFEPSSKTSQNPSHVQNEGSVPAKATDRAFLTSISILAPNRRNMNTATNARSILDRSKATPPHTPLQRASTTTTTTTTSTSSTPPPPARTKMSHEERFIPPRVKLDQLGVVKDYSAQPRLEYRYVRHTCNCMCIPTPRSHHPIQATVDPFASWFLRGISCHVRT